MAGPGSRITTRTNGLMTITPGAPGSYPTNAIMDGFIYEAAQVEEIVTNETDDGLVGTTGRTLNVGRASIRFPNTDAGVKTKDLPWADPLFPHMNVYPLVGEYVLVFKAQVPDPSDNFKIKGRYFYIGPVNIKRKVTENATPIASRLSEYVSENATRNQRAAAVGVTTCRE